MPAIDVTCDELLSLSAAAKHLPKINGRRPSTNTLWRWCRRGVRGVRLSYVRMGRTICTTPDALSQFASELAQADQDDQVANRIESPRPHRRTPAARQRAVSAAERECEAAGI